MDALLNLTRTMATLPPPPETRGTGNVNPNDDASMASTPAPFDRDDVPPDPLDDPLFDVDDAKSYVARGGAGDISTVLGTYGQQSPSTPVPQTSSPLPTSPPLPPLPPPPPSRKKNDEGGFFGMSKIQTLLSAIASIIACILLLIIAYAIPSSGGGGGAGGSGVQTAVPFTGGVGAI
jgi:hypothetical protein